jgi:hypothetical protein
MASPRRPPSQAAEAITSPSSSGLRSCDSGALSDAEFEQQKAKVLGS